MKTLNTVMEIPNVLAMTSIMPPVAYPDDAEGNSAADSPPEIVAAVKAKYQPLRDKENPDGDEFNADFAG